MSFEISAIHHADLKQAKAVLAAYIIAVLDNRGLTVRKAGAMTGFAAADFSRIRQRQPRAVHTGPTHEDACRPGR